MIFSRSSVSTQMVRSMIKVLSSSFLLLSHSFNSKSMVFELSESPLWTWNFCTVLIFVWMILHDVNWLHEIFVLVSRIEARSEKLSMYMLLDVNTEIYPIDEGEKILMVLSPSLNYDGSPVTSYSDQVNTPNVLLNFIAGAFESFLFCVHCLKDQTKNTLLLVSAFIPIIS